MAVFDHQLLQGTPLACLAGRAVFHGGDEVTVNVGHMDLTDPALTQSAGPSFRHIANLADLDDSLFVHPMGQDGATVSFNYDSLLSMWSSGGYLDMVSVSLAAVEAAAITTQYLSPA